MITQYAQECKDLRRFRKFRVNSGRNKAKLFWSVVCSIWFFKKKDLLSIGYMYPFIPVQRSKFNFRVLSLARISLHSSKTKAYLFGHGVSFRDSQSLLSISFSFSCCIPFFRCYFFLDLFSGLLSFSVAFYTFKTLSKLQGIFPGNSTRERPCTAIQWNASIVSSTGHVNWQIYVRSLRT